MHVPDALGERVDEFDRVDQLVDEMAGVEVKSEGRVEVDCFQRPGGGNQVVGNLGWMHFQAKFDAVLGKDLQDGFPAPGKIRISSIDVLLAGRREEIQVLPDRAAGENGGN